MLFSGSYQKRSSDVRKTGTGPPGETEIQRLNPKRISDILRVTGWETLADGSMNLKVDDAVVDALAHLQPTLEEPASDLFYPPQYQHIPKTRKAYWYYAGTARKGEKLQSVLVRRAMVPVRGIVELFAQVSLMETFYLKPNDIVFVEVQEVIRVSESGA